MSRYDRSMCFGVSDFIQYVIERDSALLRDDPEAWESRIRAKLKQHCGKIGNDWEGFTSTLAIYLGTNYDKGEDYEFILSLLANAAYLRRQPQCTKCGARRKPTSNSLVLMCPSCYEPIYPTSM